MTPRKSLPVVRESTYGLIVSTHAPEQLVLDALASLPGINCSNCAIAGTCPAYTEGQLCAYEPLFGQLDVRNAVHQQAMMAHLTQVDWRRTMHAVMQEQQLGGGALDSRLSAQIDRLSHRLDAMKTLVPFGAPPAATPASIKFSVEASGTGSQAAGGILSRMFGVQPTTDDMVNDPARAIELDPHTGRPT